MKYNVLKYLEKSVSKYPNKIAVIDAYNKITYQDLQNTSKSIASYLIKEHFFHVPIIVFMDKGIPALTTFLGILYSGNTYSLLHPEFPENRLEEINNVLESNLIITTNNYYEKAKAVFKDKKVVKYEDLINENIEEELIKETSTKILDIDPVYINFTSGSTGTPKGVTINHRSIIDFINVFTETFNISESDFIGNQAPFDFDVSVKDIYSSLCVGATLIIIPRKLFSKPKELLDFICDNKVTTLIWAVSALCLVSTFHALDYRCPKDIHTIMFSGEVMPLKHLNTWMSHLPNATFVNLYGPTEITCNSTYHIIDPNRNYEDGIPIGKSFLNEETFLLSENNERITKEDIPGEICVRGTSVGLGYYNNSEETNKRFVINPLEKRYPEIIYRTGDLGKYDKNGNLYFTGRKDFQIKYMGHRIELEEIERAINNIAFIERCCCVFDEEKQKLYCFYIGDVDKKTIYEELKKVLPIYMIPGIFRSVLKFPLNKNGKIDRHLLLKEENEKKLEKKLGSEENVSN